jgi:hypothetical protein
MSKIFFYGLFMDRSLLTEKGLHPEIVGPAVLPDYRIHIGERATLVRSASSRAYGIVMELTDREVCALYSEPKCSRVHTRTRTRCELFTACRSRDYVVPLRVELPSLQRDRITLPANSVVAQNATIVVPEPGIYSITVWAEGVPPEGEEVQGVVAAQKWLVVTDEGGRVRDEFRLADVPEGAKTQPGPFRFRRVRTKSDASPSGSSSASLGRSLRGSGNQTVIIRVFHDSAGTQLPIPDVYVDIDITNVVSGNLTANVSGYTDSNGEFNLGCWGFYEEYDGFTETENSQVELKWNNNVLLAWVGDDFVECEVTEDEQIDSINAGITRGNVYRKMVPSVDAVEFLD